jgi:hypothetical protein
MLASDNLHYQDIAFEKSEPDEEDDLDEEQQSRD